jgi:hypothetical protein
VSRGARAPRGASDSRRRLRSGAVAPAMELFAYVTSSDVLGRHSSPLPSRRVEDSTPVLTSGCAARGRRVRTGATVPRVHGSSWRHYATFSLTEVARCDKTVALEADTSLLHPRRHMEPPRVGLRPPGAAGPRPAGAARRSARDRAKGGAYVLPPPVQIFSRRGALVSCGALNPRSVHQPADLRENERQARLRHGRSRRVRVKARGGQLQRGQDSHVGGAFRGLRSVRLRWPRAIRRWEGRREVSGTARDDLDPRQARCEISRC